MSPRPMAGLSLVLPLSWPGSLLEGPSLLLAAAAQSSPQTLVSPVMVLEILPSLSLWVCSPLHPCSPQVWRGQGFAVPSLTWLPFHWLDQWPSPYLWAPLTKMLITAIPSLQEVKEKGARTDWAGDFVPSSPVIIPKPPSNSTRSLIPISEVKKRRVGPTPFQWQGETSGKSPTPQWQVIDAFTPLFEWLSPPQFDNKSPSQQLIKARASPARIAPKHSMCHLHNIHS